MGQAPRAHHAGDVSRGGPFDAAEASRHSERLAPVFDGDPDNLDAPPEFLALESAGVAPGRLAAASAEARRTGVAPFDALVRSDGPEGADLVAALGAGLGVDAIRAFDWEGPPLDADACASALRTGLLRTRMSDGRPRLLIAARGHAVARLALLRQGKPPARPAIALLTPRAFADVVVARTGAALAARIAEGPGRLHPELTVAGLPRIGWAARLALAAAAAATAASAFMFDGVALAGMIVAGIAFATLNAFRFWLAVTPREPDAPPPRIADRDLPIYTVLVALAREAASVPGLLDALERLDYPPAKLDVKLLIEQADHETLGALTLRPPRFGVEVLALPPGGPQTKPRALNAGLLAARGTYLTVFDAEDRPDPDQLRVALDAFRRGPETLGCAQARLAIDNLADGWIARQFAIEYAALFDVGLPALARRGLPIALGGTSNHFRTAALRTVGGWDAGNVTEDADLGLRLARLGWTTQTIASTTWEEATVTVWPWIKQRTRWMKGFMVTALVHGRSLPDLARRLGPSAFVTSQLLIGGVAFTALAYPVVMTSILINGLLGAPLMGPDSPGGAALTALHAMNLVVGYATGVACGWIGVDRRGPSRLAIDLLTMPAYWFLVGVAAWRALWQIVGARTTHWEKTQHGVSQRRANPRPLKNSA